MATKAELPLIHPSAPLSVFGSRGSSFSKAKLCNAHILELSWAVLSASCPPEIFNQGHRMLKSWRQVRVRRQRARLEREQRHKA